MKKLLTGILLLGTMTMCAFATDSIATETIVPSSTEETPTIKLNASFDWANMPQVQRDKKIADYQHLLFVDSAFGVFRKKDWNDKYKSFFKDKDHKEHYRQTKNGVTELEDSYLCGFYTKSGLLISYAIQYKNDMKHAYYYDAYGNLRFIDEMSDNYPEFPYTSKQYKKSGKLVSAIVFETRDIQYMYEPNEKFKGIWLKEKMFDKNGKQLMTRTNW